MFYYIQGRMASSWIVLRLSEERRLLCIALSKSKNLAIHRREYLSGYVTVYVSCYLAWPLIFCSHSIAERFDSAFVSLTAETISFSRWLGFNKGA